METELVPVSSAPLRPARPRDAGVWSAVRRARLVQRALESRRFEPIGLSVLDAKGEEARRGVFVVYRYDDDTTLEVLVDLARMRVVQLARRAYQPALTAGEEERAIALARQHPVIAKIRGVDRWDGRAITWQPKPRKGQVVRRTAQVGFYAEGERLARAIALVDLSRERVTRAEKVGER